MGSLPPCCSLPRDGRRRRRSDAFLLSSAKKGESRYSRAAPPFIVPASASPWILRYEILPALMCMAASLLGANFGDIDMEVANGIGLELALLDLAVFDVRQPRDPMALVETAVQGRTGQVRCRGLKGVEAVVERLERVLAGHDDDRLVPYRKQCRLRFLRPRP